MEIGFLHMDFEGEKFMFEAKGDTVLLAQNLAAAMLNDPVIEDVVRGAIWIVDKYRNQAPCN